MGSLDGQVALITGCSRVDGIGRAIAHTFARAGASVAVTSLSSEPSQHTAPAHTDDQGAVWRGLPSLVEELERYGVNACAWTGDVSRPDDVDRMMSDTIAAFGKVDILVNNAAAPHGADRNWTWEVPPDAFDFVLRVNTIGTFLMSASIARHLLTREAPGRIINVASSAGRQGRPQRAAYSASKFAVIGLTQAMAAELAPHRVTVNAVCPGVTTTSRQAHGSSIGTSGIVAAGNQIPIGHMAIPADVARAALFLAEPDADYITGECINVNGGEGMY